MKKGVNNSMERILLVNLIALFLIILIPSCKEAAHHESNSSQVPTQLIYSGIKYTTVDSLENGFKFNIVSIDTLTNEKSNVIQVDFSIASSDQFWKELKTQGIEAVYISLSCTGLKRYTSPINYYSEKFLSLHDEFLLVKEGNRIFNCAIPIRSLELSKGKHELNLVVEAIPVRFKQDSLKSDLKEIDYFSHKSIAFKKIKFQINAPELIYTSIEVLKFKLNTKVCDPSKFDYAFGGTGFPDLFWDIQCGDDYIYHSPQIKNVIQYNKPYQSNYFLCTPNDKITIRAVDFDKGPFNTQHDIIETWSGNINDISIAHPDTFVFGNLEYLIVQRKEPKKAPDKRRKNK
ncbi:hypothetical protein CHU_1883 [Sporocytophaga myxococcoides]|uniref:Uncharacterized protein n=1 Tax=Sporocytophaga myxococcoides TaxID=153721 RepID=A0A098LMV6_9BACT|nr:hypothetical protein [Sporocytophaga myxococcoides]GAL87448.1 hypothetical protein CHU_1883 [Sporocytophaga myxococcoides]